MRKKKVILNILSNLFQQLVIIVCGLIVPRMIIGTYGSDINGTISSITQFLGYITLIESGIGGVVKAELYKPLAYKNYKEVSGIINATERFFRRVAYLFIIYVIVLIFIYPKINKSHDLMFTSSMILAISIGTLIQYYFGMTYQLMLAADQKLWLISTMQSVTLILNAIFTVILILLGCSIITVKLVSSFIFMLRPLVYNIYVRRQYDINKKVEPTNDVLKQRWDGFGQHIAYFIHTNTDIVILTIFSRRMSEVSVYSVYMLVVNSVKGIISSISSGISASLGNLYAKQETIRLNKIIDIYELFNMMIINVLFGTTAFAIVPFVALYTNEVADVNYIRPIFAFVIVASEAAYCLRFPYSDLVFVAGHFRQTRNGAYFEAILNIIVSVLLVFQYGIIGVAIGTLFSMILRSIQYVQYLSKNIINRPIKKFYKKFIVNLLLMVLYYIILSQFDFKSASVLGWICSSIGQVLFISAIVLVGNWLFDRKLMEEGISYVCKRKQVD